MNHLLTASGRSEVPPFMVMDVMAAAARIEAAGGHVIHMEVGQPAAPAPKTAIAAARAALDDGRIDYTSALGIPSLRARIARHYRDAYGCAVDAERIVVTTGSSGGFILAFLAMFEPGDRVAVTVPGYPPYRHILTALGCEPVLIETTSDTRHALTGEALLAAHRKTPLKGVLVGSPANPTGTMMSREALASLIECRRKRRHPLHLGRDLSRSRLCISRSDRGRTVAAGARHQLVLEIFLHDRLAGRLDGGAGTAGAPDRAAAAKSLDLGADAVADRGRSGVRGSGRDGGDQAGYQENRRILIEGLPKAGLTKFLPADGAFYLYADVSDFTADSFAFASEMLEKAHVAATPGRRFRSDPRPRLHPVLLCALGRRDAGSGCADRALA